EKSPGPISASSNGTKDTGGTSANLSVTAAVQPQPQASPTPNYGGIIFGQASFNDTAFFKINPDGTNRISLTDLGSGSVLNPSVSSQTGMIAFQGNSLKITPSTTDPYQGTRIFVMNGDGSGVR